MISVWRLNPTASASTLSEVREPLRFGAVFFGANLLLMAIWRGGEVTITAFAGARSEIAFYSIASAIAMAMGSLMGQVSTLLLPSVTSLHLRGKTDRSEEWLAALLRYETLVAVAFSIAVFAFSDEVLPRLLGQEQVHFLMQ